MIDSEVIVGTGLRITVSKDELSSKLAIVARGVSTRTAVLVLGGIQLRAEGGKLHLAATDMEVSLRATVDAQIADEGAVVVPGRLLLDISRSLPDGEVSIEHKPEEAVVVVTAGSATYRLHTYSSEDFPRLPEFDDATLPAVERDALVETLVRCGRSASRCEDEVPLPREEPLEVVRRVSLMAQGNSPIRLRFGDGELAVSAITQDVGEARESLPVPYTADPLEIGFNAEFLRDGLESVDS